MTLSIVRRQVWLFAAFAALFFVFMAPLTASAAEDESASSTQADETYEDIDVDEDPSTNPWALRWRNFREPIQLLFTFDPVKKAEKAIRFAEERQIIAEKIIEAGASEEAVERAEELLERAQELAERAQERAEEFLENPDDRAQRLIRNLTAFDVRGEDRLDRIEGRVPEEKLEDFYAFRDRVTDRAAKVQERIENSDRIPEELQERAAERKEALLKRRELQDSFREELRAITADGVDDDEKEALHDLLEQRRDAHKETVSMIRQKEEAMEARKESLEEAAEDGDERAAAALDRMEDHEEAMEARKEAMDSRREDRRDRMDDRREAMQDADDSDDDEDVSSSDDDADETEEELDDSGDDSVSDTDDSDEDDSNEDDSADDSDDDDESEDSSDDSDDTTTTSTNS